MAKFGAIAGKANPTVLIIVGGAIFVLILIIILVFAKRSKAEVIARFKVKRLTAEAGGEIPSGWTPQALTDRLYDAIYSFPPNGNDHKTSATDFNSLNDNQRIEVYNDWSDRYFVEDNESLYRAMDGEFGYFETGGINQWDLAKSNLVRLNLP